MKSAKLDVTSKNIPNNDINKGHRQRLKDKFFSNPKDLYALEKATKATTDAVAAQFMSVVLSSLDEQIRNSGVRNERYSVQRTRKRTLVSSVGDLTFDCTLYRRKGLAKG